MSIIVFIESDNNNVKKSSFEAITYAHKLGAQIGKDVLGVAMPGIDKEALEAAGAYGVGKIHQLEGIADELPQLYANALKAAADQLGGEIVVFASSTLAEGTSSRLSIKMDASLATNVVGLPDTTSGFVVKRSVFTSKAFSNVSLSADKKVLVVKKNSLGAEEVGGSAAVETISADSGTAAFKITATKMAEGDILLPEADLVVSAGRGLKGPENWGMIEELAKVLGAATACSKPVSDVGWRPHHEHVGQTGIKVSPNLYIAIGISGAIQHLAGVSSSKVIVVINTDPEAPFFKAADYGIVGDAFEVVPKLIEAFKNSL